MTNLEQAQQLVLGMFMSDYPDGMGYDEVIECMVNDKTDEHGDYLVTVWEGVEDVVDIVEFMDDFIRQIVCTLDAKDASK